MTLVWWVMPKVHDSWTVLPHEPIEDAPAAALNAVADSLE
jgi:hypothetical protein